MGGGKAEWRRFWAGGKCGEGRGRVWEAVGFHLDNLGWILIPILHPINLTQTTWVCTCKIAGTDPNSHIVVMAHYIE